MKRQLRDTRILLTGASSGIGRCLGEQLAESGARVALTARSGDVLDTLAEDYNRRFGGEVLSLVGDVAKHEDRARLLDQVENRFGGLDILINNAGVTSWAHFTDSSEAVLRRIMEVNFFGPVELMRSAIPMLKKSKQPAIVNVASMCGRRAMPAWPEYSASKYALCGMNEAIRGEMVRFGIDVLLMIPGLTRTSLHDNMLKNEGRAKIDFSNGLPPETTATKIVAAMRRNARETVIGGDARWMLFVNRFFPRMVDRLLARKVRRLYAMGDV